jgi:hypothetical protein
LVLNSNMIKTSHFIMKKLLLFAFVFSFLLASAQQETFEFLDINDVQNPFTKENAYISPKLYRHNKD